MTADYGFEACYYVGGPPEALNGTNSVKKCKYNIYHV